MGAKELHHYIPPPPPHADGFVFEGRISEVDGESEKFIEE